MRELTRLGGHGQRTDDLVDERARPVTAATSESGAPSEPDNIHR
jgi:hypothetical protein